MNDLINDWVSRGLEVFRAPNPCKLTDCGCMECTDHEATLKRVSVHTITMKEVGQPGWSAISMANLETRKYFLPGIIRLSGDPVDACEALDMMLLVIAGWGADDDRLLRSCTSAQRGFICRFLEHLVENQSALLDRCDLVDDVLAAHTLWSAEP